MPALFSKEIHLKSRPIGLPKLDDFELNQVEIPEPQKGEILVRNLWISIDPYMRGRMIDRPSYISPFPLNTALEGGAIGQVISSTANEFKAGEYVQSMFGWREAFIAQPQQLKKLKPTLGPLEAYLGSLGTPGLTAYTGLFRIAKIKKGDFVFISGASSTVGAAACQLAKAQGCYVVGSASSVEKCTWLEQELGIDRAINYKTCGDLTQALASVFPEGIDVYFENVGGQHLQAALAHMREFGRIALCGMIEEYNDHSPRSGPNNLYNIVIRKLHLEGFVVMDHFDLRDAFYQTITPLVEQGKFKYRQTVMHGIETAPQALRHMFTGQSFGKMLVYVGPASHLLAPAQV